MKLQKFKTLPLSLRLHLRIKSLSPWLCRRRRWLAEKTITDLLAAFRRRSCQSQLSAHMGMVTPCSLDYLYSHRRFEICFCSGIWKLQPVKMLEIDSIRGTVVEENEISRLETMLEDLSFSFSFGGLTHLSLKVFQSSKAEFHRMTLKIRLFKAYSSATVIIAAGFAHLDIKNTNRLSEIPPCRCRRMQRHHPTYSNDT